MADLVGLVSCFEAFLPKPNVMIEDQAVSDWRQCIQVTPNESTGRTLADYGHRLGREP